MEVATGAMGTLLPKLADLLTDEYKLHKGLRAEIRSLETELERMQAALLEISEAPMDQPPGKQVNLWAKQVRDLSYDIEDNIDKFMVHVDGRASNKSPNKRHSFSSFINGCRNLLKTGKDRHRIGVDIVDIKSRLREAKELLDRYKVDNVVAKSIGPTIDSLRLSALYNKATDLIGIEKKNKKLVNMLKEGDKASVKQLKMVSIVGFGGLGKTTLAHSMYQKLEAEFDCGAFVSVSYTPVEKIFKNLLHQLDKKVYSNINEANWREAQLISELRGFLQNKRYFIIIDDIWDKNVWRAIKHAFIENEYGSRVIATTRNLDVAKKVGRVYQLQSLSIDDSRKLFYQRIFGCKDTWPPEQLAEVSKNILKKCGGVPLAIVTTASLLANKEENNNTLKYWSMVCKSMGSGLKNSPNDLRNMRRILSVSYYDLPPDLKACLLYLSRYPEDYEIEVKELIMKWVGEGFVQEQQGKSLYEVGEDYIDELINKNLIQPARINFANKVCSFRVHDMVFDLIISLMRRTFYNIRWPEAKQGPSTIPPN